MYSVVTRTSQCVEHGDHRLALGDVTELDPCQAIRVEYDLLRGSVPLLQTEAGRKYNLLSVLVHGPSAALLRCKTGVDRILRSLSSQYLYEKLIKNHST